MRTQMRKWWQLIWSKKKTVSYLLFGVILAALIGAWFMQASSQAPPPTEATKPAPIPSPSKITVLVAGGDESPLGGPFVTNENSGLSLGPNALNDAGELVFYNSIASFVTAVDANTSYISQQGIFRKVGNTISKIVVSGDPAPGGGEFFELFSPVANQVGDVAFVARVKTGSKDGGFSEGVFLVSEGKISLITTLPNPDLWSYVSVTPALNNNGEVVLKLPVADDVHHQEIVRVVSGVRSKTVGEEDIKADLAQQWPSIADGSPLAVNDAGDVVVRADGPQAKILLIPRGQKPVTVVTVGDLAPGGGTYLGVGLSTINNRREIAFGGLIDVQQETSLGAITLASGGQFIPIVREGDPAPTGEIFTVVAGAFSLNDRGDVIFVAGTSGKPRMIGGLFPVSGGILLYSQGQIRTVMLIGDPSPLGGVFLGMGSPVLNNTGLVAFDSSIDTDGDNNPNNRGIFAVDMGPRA